MKNLIDEINGNKLLSNSKISEDFKRGFNRGLDLSQEIINQYNIITAPKSIKLSEIVDILETIYFVNYNIHRVNNDIYIHEKGTTYYSNFNIEISDKKITDIQLDYLFDEAKELYTLWIASTEIIDDLKEDDKQ